MVSGFFQDDIELVADTLRLTVGTKVEHNEFTGWEYQPSARLSLTPTREHTFWGAVTRALQVPGRNLDGISSIVIPTLAAFPLTVVGHGSQTVVATELQAYELGHRWQPRDNFSFDTALFYHHYNRLIDGNNTLDLVNGIVNSTAFNSVKADSYGFELSSKWHVNDWWRLTAAYSWLKVDFNDSTSSILGEGRDPRNTVSLRSSFDLPHGVELDLWGRYVDHLPSLNVRAYLDMDIRLGWHATRNVEIAVVGQNLISPRRTGFTQDQFTVTLVNPVQRSVFAQVTWRF